jgi:hypothetical protein
MRSWRSAPIDRTWWSSTARCPIRRSQESSTRPIRQIRMAAVSGANLRLCGSHAGVSIGEDGPSQMALEDLAMMRAVHGSTVLYPCDANQTARLVGAMADLPGISCLRMTRAKTPVTQRRGKLATRSLAPLRSRRRPSPLQGKPQGLGPPRAPYREGRAAAPPRTLRPNCAVPGTLSPFLRTAQYLCFG